MVFSFIEGIDNNDDKIDDNGDDNNANKEEQKTCKKTLSSLSLNAGDDDANDVDDDEVDIFSVRRPFPISAGVDICLGAPTTTTRY